MTSILKSIKNSLSIEPWKYVQLLFFPFLFVYLELLLHFYLKMNLKYFPIYLFFSMSIGFFFSCVQFISKSRLKSNISIFLTFIISLLYVIEIIAKKILRSFFTFSILEVAKDNNVLGNYYNLILSAIINNFFIIIAMFIPLILIIVFRKKVFSKVENIKFFLFPLFIVFHIIGLIFVNISWSGDITPRYLYSVNINNNDQVEQLGLYNTLRLDIKYKIFPPSNNSLDAFAGINSDYDINKYNKNTNNNPVSSTGSAIVGTSTGSAIEGNTQSEQEEIDTSPNIIDIDFTNLKASNNQDIAWLANYFENTMPTNKNKYTGKFKDYNVIFITIEGFTGYAVNKDITPTLYKMLNEGFKFNNFYTALHFTSTSNGECQNLLGLYPRAGNPISMRRTGELGTNTYFSLARQLKKLGYINIGYHNNSEMYGRTLSHPNLGYDWRFHDNGLDYEVSSYSGQAMWPQKDSYMVEASVNDYINSDNPFNIYYLTITGHTPYSWNFATTQYKEALEPYSYSDRAKTYLGTAMEVDKMMKTLIDKLSEANKLDKTLIVAASDHIPYFDVDIIEELAGTSFGETSEMDDLNESKIDFDIYKNSLIIWNPNIEHTEINKVCCQVDILPTVSNLLGLEYDSRMLAGSDILSDSSGLVIFATKCWKTDVGFYNRFTQEFTPNDSHKDMTNEEIEAYVNVMKQIVTYKLEMTHKIIENNFYNYIDENKKQTN